MGQAHHTDNDDDSNHHHKQGYVHLRRRPKDHFTCTLCSHPPPTSLEQGMFMLALAVVSDRGHRMLVISGLRLPFLPQASIRHLLYSH